MESRGRRKGRRSTKTQTLQGTHSLRLLAVDDVAIVVLCVNDRATVVHKHILKREHLQSNAVEGGIEEVIVKADKELV